MTAPATSAKVPTRLQGRLLEYLREIHARWLQDVNQVIDPALRPEAGSWIRWTAVRQVNKTFFDRFEREHAVTESLRQHMGGAAAAGLWAAAELIVMLRWQLDHQVGLCHHPEEFSVVTLKLVTVIEHWCRKVEDALGQLSWNDLPDETRQAFLALHDEEDPYDA